MMASSNDGLKMKVAQFGAKTVGELRKFIKDKPDDAQMSVILEYNDNQDENPASQPAHKHGGVNNLRYHEKNKVLIINATDEIVEE